MADDKTIVSYFQYVIRKYIMAINSPILTAFHYLRKSTLQNKLQNRKFRTTSGLGTARRAKENLAVNVSALLIPLWFVVVYTVVFALVTTIL